MNERFNGGRTHHSRPIPPRGNSQRAIWIVAAIGVVILGYILGKGDSRSSKPPREIVEQQPIQSLPTAEQAALANGTPESRAKARALCRDIYQRMAPNLKPENTDDVFALFLVSEVHSGDVTLDSAIQSVMKYKKYRTEKEAIQKMRPFILDMAADPEWFKRELNDRLSLPD